MKVDVIENQKEIRKLVEKTNVINYARDIIERVGFGFRNTEISDCPMNTNHIWKFRALLHIDWHYDRLKYNYLGQLYVFLHTIPIKLKSVPKPQDYERLDADVDPLGAYFHSINGDSPFIEIYVDSILQNIQNNYKDFAKIFTFVLIHELAHAYLDISNYFDCPVLSEPMEGILDWKEYRKWKEESLANAIALHVIRRSGDYDLLYYSFMFAEGQAEEYRLGWIIEAIETYKGQDRTYLEEEMKQHMDEKIQGVNNLSKSLQHVKNFYKKFSDKIININDLSSEELKKYEEDVDGSMHYNKPFLLNPDNPFSYDLGGRKWFFYEW